MAAAQENMKISRGVVEALYAHHKVLETGETHMYIRLYILCFTACTLYLYFIPYAPLTYFTLLYSYLINISYTPHIYTYSILSSIYTLYIYTILSLTSYIHLIYTIHPLYYPTSIPLLRHQRQRHHIPRRVQTRVRAAEPELA